MVEQNRVKLGLRNSCNMYVGYLRPFSVQEHVGSFASLVSRWHAKGNGWP